jgi:hypothetical protein
MSWKISDSAAKSGAEMPTKTGGRKRAKPVSLPQLETQVGRLAARWRGAEDEQAAATIVREYQTTLRIMIANGFTSPLDVDAELPDALMPKEYLALFS